MSDDTRERVILGRLLKLLDVKSAPPETTSFLKEVSHNELLQALQYWIDQTKTVFGEVVWTQQNQGLSDDGVDFLVDFEQSKMRIGFQAKSYGDVREKDFVSKVRSQVARSLKHGLQKFVVAFGSDLTDASQLEKVRMLTSELHQYGEYCITIPPERMVTIVTAYRNKEHPLKVVITDMEDASILLKGVAESLSNEERIATASIEVRMKNVNSGDSGSIELKLSTDRGGSIADIISRSNRTGESVEISADEIEKVQVYDKNGRPLLPEGKKPDKLTIKPEKQRTPPLIMQSITKDGKVIRSLDGIVLVLDRRDGNNAYLAFENTTLPLQLTLVRSLDGKTGHFQFNFDADRSDVVESLDSALFYESLREATSVRFILANNGKLFEEGKIANPNLPALNGDLVRILERLALIQNKTGYRLQLSGDLDESKVRNIFIIADGIERGRILAERVAMKAKMPRIQALKMLDDYSKDGTIKGLGINQEAHANVLGHDIYLGPATALPPAVRPVGDVNELRKRWSESKEDEVELAIETFGDGFELQLEWFSASSPKSPPDSSEKVEK